MKFGWIQPWTAELAAVDQFIIFLLENCSKYFDDLLSGERSLPFGLLVFGYCEINFDIVVATYDLVHNLKKIFHFCKLLTTSENLF